jgi:hypothetical protein
MQMPISKQLSAQTTGFDELWRDQNNIFGANRGDATPRPRSKRNKEKILNY